MLAKLVVLAVLMSGTIGTQAQAQKNTDVPSGPAVWPLIKSPAQPQTGPAPQGNTAGPQRHVTSEPAPGASQGSKQAMAGSKGAGRVGRGAYGLTIHRTNATADDDGRPRRAQRDKR